MTLVDILVDITWPMITSQLYTFCYQFLMDKCHCICSSTKTPLFDKYSQGISGRNKIYYTMVLVLLHTFSNLESFAYKTPMSCLDVCTSLLVGGTANPRNELSGVCANSTKKNYFTYMLTQRIVWYIIVCFHFHCMKTICKGSKLCLINGNYFNTFNITCYLSP